MNSVADNLLTLSEVAERCKGTVRSVQNWMRIGVDGHDGSRVYLGYYRVGNKRFITKEQLDDFIIRQTGPIATPGGCD